METGIWKNDSADCSTCDLSMENSSTTTWIGRTTASDRVRAAVYWMIFVVGVASNLLVLSVVIWRLVKSQKHQAMTIIVGSLAVPDLRLLLWVTWLCALLSVNPQWTLGKLDCKMHILWRSP